MLSTSAVRLNSNQANFNDLAAGHKLSPEITSTLVSAWAELYQASQKESEISNPQLVDMDWNFGVTANR